MCRVVREVFVGSGRAAFFSCSVIAKKFPCIKQCIDTVAVTTASRRTHSLHSHTARCTHRMTTPEMWPVSKHGPYLDPALSLYEDFLAAAGSPATSPATSFSMIPRTSAMTASTSRPWKTMQSRH